MCVCGQRERGDREGEVMYLPPIYLLSLQLLLLSYRLEYGFTGLSPQLLLKCRLVRVAAHAMSLLLAVHLDYDTERRYQKSIKTFLWSILILVLNVPMSFAY